jgi:hypothetical protein
LKRFAVGWNVGSQGDEATLSHQVASLPVLVVQASLQVRWPMVETAP